MITNIAGASRFQKEIAESKGESSEGAWDGDPLNLVPEPENKYDKNAIVVVNVRTGKKLGYIPAAFNVRCLEMLKKCKTYIAKVLQVTGGPKNQKAYYGMNIKVEWIYK